MGSSQLTDAQIESLGLLVAENMAGDPVTLEFEQTPEKIDIKKISRVGKISQHFQIYPDGRVFERVVASWQLVELHRG